MNKVALQKFWKCNLSLSPIFFLKKGNVREKTGVSNCEKLKNFKRTATIMVRAFQGELIPKNGEKRPRTFPKTTGNGHF